MVEELDNTEEINAQTAEKQEQKNDVSDADVVNQSESQQNTDDKSQKAAENTEEKLQAELKESRDKYLRLFAEFDNFKKREAKEKREWIKTAGQDIVRDLLPVLDDIARASKTLDSDNNFENFTEGAKLIFDKFQKSLQQKGLKAIESKGKEFNTEYHEAIAEIPAPSSDMKGKIIDEVECGYTLNDVIIRYAKVVVGN